jgi:hypothetical protein
MSVNDSLKAFGDTRFSCEETTALRNAVFIRGNNSSSSASLIRVHQHGIPHHLALPWIRSYRGQAILIFLFAD